VSAGGAARRVTKATRPVILVSNDDGIHAPGIAALARALESSGEVWVVAPDRERSAVGHALTLHRPLTADQLGPRRFAVNGTPSDCVNLALLGLLPVRPDIVVAGVNAGSNLGDDVTYSGTVSAALEAALLGVPGVAISLIKPTGSASYRPAGRTAARLVRLFLRDPGRGSMLLNVNVPPGLPRGVRLTRLGRRLYSEKVVERQDPRGRRYFWIGVGPPAWESGADTDHAAVHAGYVSVTPLMLDLTDYPALRGLKDWETESRRPLRGRRTGAGR
jgi:5'-nucleotidase